MRLERDDGLQEVEDRAAGTCRLSSGGPSRQVSPEDQQRSELPGSLVLYQSTLEGGDMKKLLVVAAVLGAGWYYGHKKIWGPDAP